MKHWHIKERKYISEHASTTSIKEMAEHLQRSITSVKAYMNRNKIKGRDARFVKGEKPWNDGKTGFMGANKTSFKKGSIPHNAKSGDGVISLRYHKGEGRYRKFIRVSLGKWVQLARHVWEQKKGPIPKGHVVIHLDGDTLNCDIDNLLAISKAENAKRNQNREKAAKTLQSTWNSVKALKRYGIDHHSKFSKRVKNIY